MLKTLTSQNLALTYNHTLYDIKLSVFKKHLDIQMQMYEGIYTTDSYKHTYDYLYEKFPEVLFTKCYNTNNLSFHDEVKSTELPHLFEHILIAYMFLYKASTGCNQVSYKGTTYWNWKINPKGFYEISINAGMTDLPVINKSLLQAIKLFNNLLA